MYLEKALKIKKHNNVVICSSSKVNKLDFNSFLEITPGSLRTNYFGVGFILKVKVELEGSGYD